MTFVNRLECVIFYHKTMINKLEQVTFESRQKILNKLIMLTSQDRAEWFETLPLNSDEKNKLFIQAAFNGQLDLLIFFSTLKNIWPESFGNLAIRTAAENGHLEVVKFLTNLPDVNPRYSNNHAIRIASAKGHLDVVKYLLTIPDIDITAEDNEAFCMAVKNGHVSIVKFLAQLPEVDPCAQGNRSILDAAFRGELEMVKYLLTLPNVDPPIEYDHHAIISAAMNKHLDVFLCLASLNYYNPYYPGLDKEEQVDRTDFLDGLMPLNDNMNAYLRSEALAQYRAKTGLYTFFAHCPEEILIKDARAKITTIGLTFDFSGLNL